MVDKKYQQGVKTVPTLSFILAMTLVSMNLSAQPLALLKEKQVTRMPWHKKVNYFGNISAYQQSISLSREPTNQAISRDSFKGDSNTFEGRFSAGGKLLSKGSIYTELTLDQTELKGQISRIGAAQFIDSVNYRRHKTRLEVFYEYDLTHGYAIGVDIYAGAEQYKHQQNRFTDKELGGAVLLSHSKRWQNANLDFDYIISYRELDFESASLDDTSQVYHSFLVEYGYQFTHFLNLYIGGRHSVFPNYVEHSYWRSQSQQALMSEAEYRLDSSASIAVKFEKLWLSNGGHTHTLFVKYEYRFGGKNTKRRKRKYKTPNLLIR
ncbi:hypothetical protein L1077_14925 [Pseudoalteromonas luteoviolacea]|uniref:hypothetical protein n=1 Tax=Pseudoalteromonas luteoviolacea TaxID=43657 RepID=UPI001F44E1BB|nr:hypothetical protein [Pseudoalteromonas luteoviolacea]MCF6440727.1 hypothetical protein [Pseudoalteromonas luteoviolacea]